MIELLNHQAAALKRPPVTLDQLLNGLAKTVPNFVNAIRGEIEVIGK